jgi:hypothetical protein
LDAAEPEQAGAASGTVVGAAMIRKGQLRNIGGRDMRAQASLIAELFENAA